MKAIVELTMRWEVKLEAKTIEEGKREFVDRLKQECEKNIIEAEPWAVPGARWTIVQDEHVG